MKTINVVLIVLLLIIVLNISSPKNGNTLKPIYDPIQIDNLYKQEPKGVVSVTKEDIVLENRGKPVKVMSDFPIPQTTTQHKSLSTNYPEDLSIITQGNTINNSDIIIEVRDNGLSYQESHFPQYYKKDSLSANTLGTTEYRFADTDPGNLKSSNLWFDKNVSQYPSFYTSQLKDDITNVGAFFDVNNNFVDSTTPRATSLTGDVCFKTKEGEHVCLDGSRNYNPPPALISNKNNCGFLNSIGLLEFSNRIKEDGERVNNGGILYDNVKGSKKYNEVYSKPIQQPVLQCNI